MPTAATQLLSRMIKQGCMPLVLEWGIDENDMLTTEEKGIWGTLIGMYMNPATRGSVPTLITLKAAFPNFVLNDDPGLTLDALCTFTRHERIAARSRTLAQDLVKSLDTNPVQAVTLMQDELTQLLRFGRKSEDVDFHGSFSNLLTEYELTKTGKLRAKVFWPWPVLNEATGGLQEDDFIVFYGRPKSMKSWVLCFLIAQMFLQGKNVLVYTKEMTPHNILKRITACIAQLPYHELRRGKLDAVQEAEFASLAHILKDAPNKLTVLSGKDADGGDTITWLHSKIKHYQPDVVFVDGLYLMSHGGSKLTQDWQRVMLISRAARQMQLETKIPLIATMQANRSAAKNQGAALDEIAYSDAVAQDATGIFRTIKQKIPILNEMGEPTGAEMNTIALIAGGTREYDLHGIRIHGVPATDFSEIGLMAEGDAIKAQEGDKEEAKASSEKNTRAKKTAAPKKGKSDEKTKLQDEASGIVDSLVGGLKLTN